VKWSNFDYDDSRTLIKKLDLEPVTTSSREDKYNYVLDGKKQFWINMPNQHGGTGGLSTGFIKSIRLKLRLSTREFERLVDCSLSAEKFEAMIRQKLGL
jgi:hypothetical protein